MKSKATEIREVADVLRDRDVVINATALESNDPPTLEVVLSGDRITPSVLIALGEFGLSVDPDGTATRGDPTTTTVVAR